MRNRADRARRRGLGHVLCALMVSAGLGCQSYTRHKDCARLIQHVNRALTEIARELEVARGDPKHYASVAARYEALDHKLAAFTSTSPGLAGTLTSYRQVLTDAAEGARILASSDAASEAYKEGLKLLRKARSLESSAQRSIERYCRGG